jgi:hypothetical protein
MSETEPSRPSDAAPGPPASDKDERPPLMLGVLAVTAVLSLAAAGWMFNDRQQTAFRASQAESARLAEAGEAQHLREEIALVRNASAVAASAGKEAELEAERQRTARVIAEHTANGLLAELKRERARGAETLQSALTDLTAARQAKAAATAAAETLIARERQVAEAAQRQLQQAGAELAREREARQAAERSLEEVRTQLVKERNARRDAEHDAARQAAAAQPAPAAVPSASESWQSLAASRDLLALSDFASSHPSSPESDQALRRLGELIPASDDRAALAALIARAERGPIAEGARQRLAALAVPEPMPAASRVVSLTSPGGWVTYRDPRLDFVFSYPAAILSVETPGAGERERIFQSRDGKVRLRAYSGANGENRSLAAYRSARLEQGYAGARLDYAPVRRNWFVLSGTRNDEMFYERITFTCNGKAVHGWTVVYPLAERSVYDRVVEEIHRSYKYAELSDHCG